MFPPEVWKIVLKKINNPLKLMNLQIVCRDWFEIIETIVRHHKKWVDLCIAAHLPMEFIWYHIEKRYSAISFNTHNLYEHRNEIKPCIWRDIYCSHQKWQRIVKIPHAFETIKSFPLLSQYEKIMCTAIWDDILAIATSEGFIYCCKIYNLKNMFYIADHKNHIKQIAFWYQDKRLILISTCINAKLKFWDIFEMKEIGTTGYLGHIISISYNHRLYCEFRGTVTNYIYFSHNIRKGSKYELHLDINEKVVLMFTNYDDIRLLTLDGTTTLEYIIMIEMAVSCDYPVIFSTHFTVILQIDDPSVFINMKQFYRWGDEITIGLSDKFLAVSNAHHTWTIHNVFKILCGIVTSVTFHTNIMILGLDSGTIYIFHVKYDNIMKFIDFGTCQSKEILLDNEPIVKLNVTETQNEPFIIAATESNIHVVRFF